MGVSYVFKNFPESLPGPVGESQFIKSGTGDCFFKCADTSIKLQGM